MENATEALHMAAGVLIFVLALSITIASFSVVRTTATTIIQSKDSKSEENGYSYSTVNLDSAGQVTGTERVVGKETIIPSLYRAFKENYIVRFFDRNGNPIYVYQVKKTSKTGGPSKFEDTNEIDLQASSVGSHTDANALITALLSGKNDFDKLLTENNKIGKFTWFKAPSKTPTFFSVMQGNPTFVESLGIYYQEDAEGANQTDSVNKTEKRVITYRQI